jgi:hypothetical protein
VEENGVVNTIECLLDVKEEDGTLESTNSLLTSESVLNTCEEVVNGIRRGEALTEPELGWGEVLRVFKFGDQSAVDEMFEYSDDNTGHGDWAVGAG